LEIEEATAIDQGMGPRIQAFVIETATTNGWKTIHEGGAVGENLRCEFFPVETKVLRLRITGSSDGPTIRELRVLEGNAP
jgi:hypothetical protein